MNRPDPRAAFLATAVALAASLPFPAAASSAPPFCVARGGGPEGGGTPQICAYSDYQACLQAAADLHGNCVQNIDYHGDVSTAPARPRTRHRR